MRCRVLIQTVILGAVAVSVGVLHSRNSGTERERILENIGAWKRQAARNSVQPTTNVTTDDSTAGNSASSGEGEGSDPANREDIAPDTAPPPNDSNWQLPPPEVTGEGDVPTIDVEALGPEIEMTAAAFLFNEGLATFVDAREYAEYKKGHIDGAFAMPYEVVREGTELPHLDNGLIFPGETIIVVYCQGGDCDESHLVAQELRAIGFVCHVFVDGYPAWKDAGHSVAEGPDPWLVDLGAEPDH